MTIAIKVLEKVIGTVVKSIAKEGKIGDGTLQGEMARRDQAEKGVEKSQEIERRERANRTA